VLDPRSSWSDKSAYDRMAKELVGRFEKNFAGFEAGVGDEVRAAAIRAAA
jgi:phosphoenolpyruvate carboxykinase (ATP)